MSGDEFPVSEFYQNRVECLAHMAGCKQCATMWDRLMVNTLESDAIEKAILDHTRRLRKQ